MAEAMLVLVMMPSTCSASPSLSLIHISCDASGNLARASADIKPAGTRTSPFGDMAGHWAEPYATYLYDTGVSKGTGVEIPVYQPEKNITRAEFFAMVARWMDLDLTCLLYTSLPLWGNSPSAHIGPPCARLVHLPCYPF